MMKKQTVVALVLLLLIPIVLRVGGFVFSLINPESAAGHPDYARNYHFLNNMKLMSLWGSFAVVAILWLLVCFFVIRSKERSLWWVLLAAFGPFGFAVFAMLRDRAPRATDQHERFVGKLNWLVWAGYQACMFIVIWMLAYGAMVFKRGLMILYESATTGISVAEIIDRQNASSGMWAFAEGNEVMYMVALLYLLWPIVFNIAFNVGSRVAATVASAKAG